MEVGINKNPVIYEKQRFLANETERITVETDPSVDDPIDELEIFDLVRNITDPEHPLTLEQLNVLTLDDVSIDLNDRLISVGYTPTVPNCSSGALIGLMILAKLKRTVSHYYKVRVFINPGTHDLEEAINKQLGDKERVAAAFENGGIIGTINEKLRTSNEEVDLRKILHLFS